MARYKACPIVGHRLGYWSRYDMFGCPDCDEWSSSRCSCRALGHDCPFEEAPKKPSLSTQKPEIFRVNEKKVRK